MIASDGNDLGPVADVHGKPCGQLTDSYL